MNRPRSLGKMFIYMLIFGTILGAIAGALVGFVMLLPEASSSDIFDLLYTSVLFGGVFGAIYGGTAGFISGIIMTVVTAVAYREINNVKRYKLVMGAITAVVTSGVFILGGLWRLGLGMELAWTSAMILSVVIATYASQIVAKKYIRDMSIRKKKVGA